MSDLKYGQAGPQSGTADSLVIFLHGYGADGADLLGLADPLAPHLPNTLFIAPDAPNPCSMSPMGREWFPIPRIDGSTQAAAEAGLARATTQLDDWLLNIAKTTGVAPERTVLVGFSQGTMMSLHVAPRHKHAFAGVVGFSGRLLNAEKLADEITQKPQMILIHGDADDVVPYENLAYAQDELSKAGIDVKTLTCKGVGHSISPEGLGAALDFIKTCL